MLPKHIRSGEELQKKIRQIKLKFLKAKKKAPSTQQITNMIARRIDVDELIFDEYIKFQ